MEVYLFSRESQGQVIFPENVAPSLTSNRQYHTKEKVVARYTHDHRPKNLLKQNTEVYK